MPVSAIRSENNNGLYGLGILDYTAVAGGAGAASMVRAFECPPQKEMLGTPTRGRKKKAISTRLREWRAEKKQSPEQAALTLKIDTSRVSQIENGTRPTPEEIRKIKARLLRDWFGDVTSK
jgi:hypothetical protein